MTTYEALVPQRKLDAVLRTPRFDGEQMIVLLMVLRSEVNVVYEELLGSSTSATTSRCRASPS